MSSTSGPASGSSTNGAAYQGSPSPSTPQRSSLSPKSPPRSNTSPSQQSDLPWHFFPDVQQVYKSTTTRCDRCRRRHFKCIVSTGEAACEKCASVGEACSFNDRNRSRRHHAPSSSTGNSATRRQRNQHTERTLVHHRDSEQEDARSDYSLESDASEAYSTASASSHHRVNENSISNNISAPPKHGVIDDALDRLHVEPTERIDYEERHSASPEVLRRNPASSEELHLARSARFARVLLGVDPRKWAWKCDPCFTSAPVLFSSNQCPTETSEPYYLRLDEKVMVEACPASSAPAYLPDVFGTDWHVMGPRGETLSPPWQDIRDRKGDMTTVWPSFDYDEADFDPLRAAAAKLIGSSVVPFLVEIACTYWADGYLIYLPNLNKAILECRFPGNSVRDLGWTPEQKRHQQALLLLLAVFPTLWYGAIALEIRDRRLKVCTWELGLHMLQTAWILMLPNKDNNTPQQMTYERLAFLYFWDRIVRCRSADAQFHTRVFSEAVNHPDSHGAVMRQTENVQVERELYKRFLVRHLANTMTHRLWSDAHVPYRVGPRLQELGPWKQLPREDEEGMSHSPETCLIHGGGRAWMNMIGESMLDSALMWPLPEKGSSEWQLLRTARSTVGTEFLREIIECKDATIRLEDRSRFSNDIAFREHQAYFLLRAGDLVTFLSILISAAEQVGLNDLVAAAQAVKDNVPSFTQIEVDDGTTLSSPERSWLWQKAVSALNASSSLNTQSAIFGTRDGQLTLDKIHR